MKVKVPMWLWWKWKWTKSKNANPGVKVVPSLQEQETLTPAPQGLFGLGKRKHWLHLEILGEKNEKHVLGVFSCVQPCTTCLTHETWVVPWHHLVLASEIHNIQTLSNLNTQNRWRWHAYILLGSIWTSTSLGRAAVSTGASQAIASTATLPENQSSDLSV